jgi:Flp pilus assembly protein TadG
MQARSQSGQMMVEFAIVLATALLLFVIMGFFLDMYLSHHYRVLQLISLEYP